MITPFLYFALVSFICVPALSFPVVPKPTGTLMEFREVNDSTCFLRITICGDSLSGFFVGNDTNIGGEKIYFAAPCRELKLSGTAISFTLNDYAWSRKPMESLQGEIAGDDIKAVPVIARYGNYFQGEIGDSILSLSRISDLYDSRADLFTFTVSRTPCDCP